jgi:orotidine-5'-phosphate decarboxylase
MNPILVALDLPSGGAALALADRLRGTVGGLKVGSQLFTAEGAPLVRTLVEKGDRVFLDLKFHDIPNTVAGAVRAAAGLGVWMVNVHAGGGPGMMRAARRAADEAASPGPGRPPLLIAVTVLTSFAEETLRAVGVDRPIAEQVGTLAAMAQDAGLDGVVASPQEIGVIRRRCGPEFVIVTPGIRQGPPSPGDDQVRTMSASEAIAAGANYLVIGRPIARADDPAAAARALAEEVGW